MLAKVSAFIGIRYARVNSGNQFISFINVFSVLGISLGLAALILVSSVMNGFEAQLKRKILSLSPHIVVSSDTPPSPETFPSDVNAVSHWLELQTIVQSSSHLQGVLMRGVIPNEYKDSPVFNQFLTQGGIEHMIAGKYHVILGFELARSLDVGVGDVVRVIVPGQVLYTPLGPVPKQRKMIVTGLFRSGSEMDARLMYAHHSDVQRLTRAKTDTSSLHRLTLNDAFQLDSVITALPATYKVHETWRDRQGALFSAVKMEKNMMSLMLLLIIAVAAFNIVSSLVMVVTEKKSDIAILRTQGLSTFSIMQVFMFNGMFNGLKGCLWGVSLGLLIAYQINPLLIALNLHLLPMENGQILPVVIEPRSILMMTLLSLTFSLLATLYPAYAATKQKPAQALRYD